MELTVDASEVEDIAIARKTLYKFSEDTGLDVSLRDHDIFEKPKRVVIFDCDSTIIQGEVIDELAKVAGVSERVQDMTERAMQGELDFEQALKERVSLLKGKLGIIPLAVTTIFSCGPRFLLHIPCFPRVLFLLRQAQGLQLIFQ